MILIKKCKYYPCHKGLEDCTYCFCPIFPCRIVELGTLTKINPVKLNKDEKDKYVWDCSKCIFFHTKENVEEVKKLIHEFVTKKQAAA